MTQILAPLNRSNPSGAPVQHIGVPVAVAAEISGMGPKLREIGNAIRAERIIRTAECMTDDLEAEQVQRAKERLELLGHPAIADLVDAEFGAGSSEDFRDVAAAMKADA